MSDPTSIPTPVAVVLCLIGLAVWWWLRVTQTRAIRRQQAQERHPHPQGTCRTRHCPNNAVVMYRGPRCRFCADALASMDNEALNRQEIR